MTPVVFDIKITLLLLKIRLYDFVYLPDYSLSTVFKEIF